MYVEREERGRGIDVATKLHGCIQLIMTFVFGDNGSKLWDLLKPTLLISSVCSWMACIEMNIIIISQLIDQN